MKTGLDHLPAHKREQINAIAALVLTSAPIEMLILFGSYARGDWVEDLPNGYFSDFDFMIVVASEELASNESLWGGVSDRARAIGGRVPVTLLVHDIKQVNQEIRSGQYFFSDVVSEGVLLHDSRHYQLAKARAQTPAERLEFARRNFSYWFTSASEFWRGAGYYAARGLGPHAAFSLHQAAERYFHAVLLVFTGYKPKSHDLEALAKQTAPLHAELEDALPRVQLEDQRLFSLLKRAYIEARYSKSYVVTSDELATLRDRVLDLARRVKRACSDRLAAFNGADAVGPLPEVPSYDDAIEFPQALPPLADAAAVEEWRDAVVRMSYERGERLRREGEATGRREGRSEERASAIVDVLRRRGVTLSDDDIERILACRDEGMLDQWWEFAWSVRDSEELFRGRHQD
jgi:HEPN domain-containing protein/predicted nucleotidyltransferase